MFFNTQLLTSALLAASVLGAPNPKRDDDPCKGLGSGTYSNLAKFRLAALHSGRNQHEYGNELVLGTTGLNSTTFRVSGIHPSIIPTYVTKLTLWTPPGSTLGNQSQREGSHFG